MAYVPGFEHDLFLSYAHGDGVDWAAAFESALHTEIRRLLSPDVSSWQDVKQIRLGRNWEAAIDDALAGVAAVVAVVSPLYRASDYCTLERQRFLAFCDQSGGPEVNGIYRLLKVIKTPWPDNDHLQFLPKHQHFDFHAASGTEVHSLLPGTPEFQRHVEKAAGAIAALLQGMRRQRERVYVAAPFECRNHARELSAQLRRDGYDVQPPGIVDQTYGRDLLQKEMKGAVLSVHMFGARYDEFSAQLVDLAAELRRRVLIWTPEETLLHATPEQKAFLAELARGRTRTSVLANEADPSFINLRATPAAMVREVLEILKNARPTPSPPVKDVKRRAYLMCDITSDDFAAVQALAQAIRAREGAIEVDLPEARVETAAQAHASHTERLRRCDGLLLYRRAAPPQWLASQLGSLLYAERLLQRAPIRAKALMDDPWPDLPREVMLIPPGRGSVEDLEPFLAPLRV